MKLSWLIKSQKKARLTHYSGLEVDKHGTGDVLPSAGFAEKSVEGVVSPSDGFVAGHLAIGLDAVLQAVELPAGVADLDSGLSDVDRDALTLQKLIPSLSCENLAKN